MPHFVHDGIALNYEVTEEPDRPWLFFSNSLGADLSMWEPQLAAFSGPFRILRYDNRGHGKSSVPPGPYTIEQLATDVLALADELGVDRFHFCGLSMGGLIGQWLGINRPQRLGKLVLCDTAAKIGNAQGWEERIHTVEHGGMSSIVEGGLKRWFTPRFFNDNPEIVDRFRSIILSTAPEGYVANCMAIREADFRESASSISAPVLLVCAANDPVTTVADAKFLAESIPGSQICELDAAHLSNVEQAAAFNQSVLAFLKGETQ